MGPLSVQLGEGDARHSVENMVSRWTRTGGKMLYIDPFSLLSVHAESQDINDLTEAKQCSSLLEDYGKALRES